MADPQTGTRDVTYDLVSVLYHALQGAEICGVYRRDARGGEDQEVETFLRDVETKQREMAEGAKRLLAKRIS